MRVLCMVPVEVLRIDVRPRRPCVGGETGRLSGWQLQMTGNLRNNIRVNPPGSVGLHQSAAPAQPRSCLFSHPASRMIRLGAALVTLSCVVGCGTLSNGSAHGRDKQYIPRYTDAFDMRYGLFIHRVGCSPTQNSGLRHSDRSPIGVGKLDKHAASIDVEKVANEMQALGFEYVMITDFHGFGTMLHPSRASDRWRGQG